MAARESEIENGALAVRVVGMWGQSKHSAMQKTARLPDVTDKSKRPDGVAIWPLGCGELLSRRVGQCWLLHRFAGCV